jgi:hypothetical protein
MILQLSAVDWSDLLRGDCVNECVWKFYDAVYEWFELYVPKYIVKNCTVKYPWFDKELHNVDNNKTKAPKYLKEFETLHICQMSESDQCLYNKGFPPFLRNLGATLRVFTVWNTPSTSCVLRVVWKIILDDFSSMPTWSVTQAAMRRLCFWETIVPGTHSALQIYLMGFFKAYTCGMLRSRIVTR